MSGGEPLKIRVNGALREAFVPHHRTLLDLVRDDLGLTGTKRGCEDGSCGACTVLVDGEPRLSCLSLAFCAEGSEVTTIEGASSSGRVAAIQDALVREGGLQCGYCTPGLVLAATALIERNADPDDAEIREGISSNICRCTGYVRIVEAVKKAAAAVASAAEAVR